ncbi:hypothetical protein FRB98_001712 [Tulasnella sp. 332]|nr:hypothetical protein FRB98_001712 [Tulasnella sp. 332]
MAGTSDRPDTPGSNTATRLTFFVQLIDPCSLASHLAVHVSSSPLHMHISLFNRISLALSICSSVVYGLKFPIGSRKAIPYPGLQHRNARSASVPLLNFQNTNYNVNITLGGVIYTVIIDTGSSDLWIAADVPNAQPVGLNTNITYGVGSVAGPIMKAPLSFAGYDVPAQAFLNASSYSPDPRSSGASGLIGLGPSIISNVFLTVNDVSAGPMMNRIFEQNMTSQNYITLFLSRDDDPESTAISQMTISEPLPGYESIIQQQKLPVVLTSKQNLIAGAQQFWTTYTDVNGVLGSDGQPIIVQSTVEGAWEGTLVTVFDSGSSLPQVPKALSDSIYSKAAGAIWNATLLGGIWTVPCNVELNVTFVFGGQAIFVHPLDMSAIPSEVGAPDIDAVNGVAMCYGTFQPIGAGSAAPDHDMILGMSFLRNSYILLDYGNFIFDSSTDRTAPFIQLLALTDPVKAHTDFVTVRLNGLSATGAFDENLATTTSGSSITRGKSRIYAIVAVVCGIVLLVAGGIFFFCFRRLQRHRMEHRALGGFFMIGQGGERKYRDMNAPVPAGVDENLPELTTMEQEKEREGADESTPLTHRYQDPFRD